MHPHFLIPFFLIAYAIITNAIILYGIKSKSQWVCRFYPSASCNETDVSKKTYRMNASNVYLVLVLSIFLFFVNYNCYLENYPYYTFFMLSAVTIIISFFYLGMQLLVIDTTSYWIFSNLIVMLVIFCYAIAHLIYLQPPV